MPPPPPGTEAAFEWWSPGVLLRRTWAESRRFALGIRVGPEYFMCVEANKVVIAALGIVAVVASAVGYTQFYMPVSQGPALVLMSMFACKVRGGWGTVSTQGVKPASAVKERLGPSACGVIVV